MSVHAGDVSTNLAPGRCLKTLRVEGSSVATDLIDVESSGQQAGKAPPEGRSLGR